MGIDLAPPELTTTQVLKTYGNYKVQKIPPNQGIADLSISQTAYGWLDFEFPASVYNLSKSYVGFNVFKTDTSETKDEFTWHRQDCHAMITAVRAKIIDGSAPLVDIPYFPQYEKIFLPRQISGDNASQRSQRTKCFPIGINTWSSDNKAVLKVNGGNYGTITPDGTAIVALPNEILQANSGVVVVPDTTGDQQEFVEFNLSDMKQTVFDYVGDIYFGQRMLLSLQFGPTMYYLWNTGAAGTATGSTNPASATVVVHDSVTKIQAPFLYLAVQNNLAVAEDVRKTLLEKKQLNLPYVHCIKQGMTSTSFSANFSVARQYGTHCKMVTFSMYNSVETTAQTALDNSNITLATAANTWQASKVITYRTNWGPEPLQYYDATCQAGQGGNNAAQVGATAAQSSGPGDDWALNKQIYEGTMIAGPMAARENWSHTDLFCGPKLMDAWKDREVAGRALAPDPISWSVFGTAATAALNMFIFIVFNRVLTISENAPVTFM